MGSYAGARDKVLVQFRRKEESDYSTSFETLGVGSKEMGSKARKGVENSAPKTWWDPRAGTGAKTSGRKVRVWWSCNKGTKEGGLGWQEGKGRRGLGWKR